MFYKVADSVFTPTDIHSQEVILADADIMEKFNKYAQELVRQGKKIAPKAKDFVYFTAVMMHAAEAVLINPDGTRKKNASGEEVAARWEENGESLRWICSDPSIKPYKNHNCFIPGTLVSMADGTTKSIEKVEIGDSVMTHLGHARPVVAKIINDFKGELVEIDVRFGSKTTCTNNHPFYKVDLDTDIAYLRRLNLKKLPMAFRNAGDLKLGSLLTSLSDPKQEAEYRTEQYGIHTVTGLKKVAYDGKIYNLEVEEDHSYVANGLIVHNCDIFPRQSLKHFGEDKIPAYKKWAGKPLCVDHKSDQAESVRGLVVDTYYDDKFDRVIALCALDKLSYPDLARQITTGVSNSVSMGTGVGRAICYDCGRVARTEKDFCPCMRNRTCYGEINCELNPIELSIVVNGADPQAKIKYIIAKEIPEMERAAQRISQYIDLKEKQPEKLAHLVGQLDHLGLELARLRQEVIKFKQVENPTVTKKAAVLPEIGQINEKLDQISETLTKIAQHKDIHMVQKQGYWQGGGGVNEPALHQVKYPKEEADKIRDTEDRQMNGEPPFPGVGPVDKLYPGDEEVKRKMQRLAAAAAERRKAAVQAIESKAYWQGGGGVNEPALHQVKYPKEDADKIRDNEDRQMNGQPPFPGVGKVDGLHPSPESVKEKDELKRKEMLQRASLKARWEKAASQDASRWSFYRGDNLVDSITVAELKQLNPKLSYEQIVTAECAKALGKKVAKGESLKVGQAAPPMPAPMGEPAPEAPKEEMDAGGNGDPKEQAVEALDKLDGAAADVRKIMDAIVSDVKNDESGMQAASEQGLPPELAAHVQYRTKLAKAIYLHSKEQLADLKDLREQIQLIATMDVKKMEKQAELKEYRNLSSDALSETKEALAEVYQTIDAFKNLAKGSKLIQDKIAKLRKKAENLSDYDPLNPDVAPSPGVVPVTSTPAAPAKPAPQVPSFVPQKKEEPKKWTWDPNPAIDAQMKMYHESQGRQSAIAPQEGNVSGPAAQPAGKAPAPTQNPVTVDMKADDCMAKDEDKEEKDENDLKMNSDGTLEGSPEEVGKAMKAKSSTRAERRAKLAEQATKIKMDPILDQAHKGGTKIKLDTKATDDMDKVETLGEIQKQMVDSVNATPKVKKMAAMLQQRILEGKITVAGIPELVAQGLDPEAVKYWKQYYGEVDGGKEFATEMTTEHMKAKAEQDKADYQVKVARCFDLAYEMFHSGHLGSKDQIAKQANELMDYSDKAFERLQQFVRNASPKKSAGMPQVGVFGLEDFTPEAKADHESLVDKYSRALSGPRRR